MTRIFTVDFQSQHYFKLSFLFTLVHLHISHYLFETFLKDTGAFKISYGFFETDESDFTIEERNNHVVLKDMISDNLEYIDAFLQAIYLFGSIEQILIHCCEIHQTFGSQLPTVNRFSHLGKFEIGISGFGELLAKVSMESKRTVIKVNLFLLSLNQRFI